MDQKQEKKINGDQDDSKDNLSSNQVISFDNPKEDMEKVEKAQKNERINLFLKLLMATLFIIGAIIFSYPFVSNAINSYYDQKMMERNLAEMAEANTERQEQMLLDMQASNRELANNDNYSNIPGMGFVEDPFDEAVMGAFDPGKEYYAEHNVGAIYIPSINVSLPLFDETNNILLEKGATILQGTSYPIGGENTHSVISAHSGLTNRKLFTDLEKMMIGDEFYLDVAGKKLAYKVYEIQVVLPTDLEKLMIQEGKDLVTLLTCTPYGINTHRLLLTGYRIPYEEPIMEQEIAQTQKAVEQRFALYLILIPIFFVLILYWMYRKYVFYQSGKYYYDFCFYLNQNGKPLTGIRFVLQDERKIKIDPENQPLAISDLNGLVCFKHIRGGKYWVKAIELPLPVVKGRPGKLKEKNLRLKSKPSQFKRVKIKTKGEQKREVRYYLKVDGKA